MAHESNQTVALPSEILIGEETYTVKETPELRDFVNRVLSYGQQTERGKLYGKINKLEIDLAARTDERDNLSSTVLKLKEVKPQTQPSLPDKTMTKESMKDALKKENEKVQLTAEDIAAIIDKKFNDSLPHLLKESIDPIIARLGTAEKEHISTYRAKRLEELGDTLVPELVTGTTKEEIEQSIVASIEVRNRYQTVPPTEPIKPEKPEFKKPDSIPGAPIKIPGLPEEKVENVKDMDIGEFGKKREDLLKSLREESSYSPLNR